jgi:hypothetical protein
MWKFDDDGKHLPHETVKKLIIKYFVVLAVYCEHFSLGNNRVHLTDKQTQNRALIQSCVHSTHDPNRLLYPGEIRSRDYASEDAAAWPRRQFLKRSWRLQKKFVPTGKFCLATVALLAPRHEVGAYASFKKLPSAGLLLWFSWGDCCFGKKLV